MTSGLKSARTELETANERLEARIMERTAEIGAANERLQSEIAERKRAEDELAHRAQELARSNADLEQFAYAASHDLQEPLRAIAGFTKMLARRYQGRSDGDTDDLVARTVSAATRMQASINDLLTYSRVGKSVDGVQNTDSAAVIDEVIDSLQGFVGETAAVVTHGPLPTVMGNPSLLRQVLSNLISNGIKFRGLEPPRVHVWAKREDKEWVFAIQDNGIGLDPTICRAGFRDIPASSYPGRVSGDRHRPGHLQEGGGAPGRTHLGAVSARKGQYVQVHLAGRGQSTPHT